MPTVFRATLVLFVVIVVVVWLVTVRVIENGRVVETPGGAMVEASSVKSLFRRRTPDLYRRSMEASQNILWMVRTGLSFGVPLTPVTAAGCP